MTPETSPAPAPPTSTRARGRPRHLAAAQYGIWESQRHAPAVPLHECGVALTLTGALDRLALHRAVARALGETETLRTRFHMTPHGPRRALVPPPLPVLTVTDLRHEADPEAVADARIRADLATVTDLARQDPCAHELFLLGPERALLYFRYHHIVLDGFGQYLYLRRLAELYEAFESGRAPTAPAAVPLERLAADEAAYLRSPQYAEDAAYWHAERSSTAPPDGSGGPDGPDAPPAAEPPDSPGHPAAADGPGIPRRPVAADGHTVPPDGHAAPPGPAVSRTAVLTPHRLGTLLAAGRGEGPAPVGHEAATLIAATAVWSYDRHGGRTGIVVNLPVTARRSRAELDTPAQLANELPLRLAVDPDTSFAALVRHTGVKVREALRHQRHRAVGPSPRTAEPVATPPAPQVNVMTFGALSGFGSCRATCRQYPVGLVADIDLNVYRELPAPNEGRENEEVRTGPGHLPPYGLRLEFRANSHRHRPDDVSRHRRRFLELLDAVAGRPDLPLARHL
ncbi:condensation domain-containing protein [Streptomyces zaomyceticus]|uniref:condensation domain-containing protein n=1 Tax=Streptomyces zaomyceticus TaxID=68286 RepID=UPI0033AFCBC1